MLKQFAACTALATLSIAAQAQRAAPDTGNACPIGTHYAAMRHDIVKPGKWTGFEKAVADHSAWYASHKNGTKTVIARTLAPKGGLSSTEAVTITRYAPGAQPNHDAAYDAFIAEYRASSTVKDEVRLCLPN